MKTHDVSARFLKTRVPPIRRGGTRSLRMLDRALPVFLCLTWAATTLAQGWYNPWAFRQTITISSNMTSGALADFPVLVRIADPANPLFAKAQASGNDLLFTADDGTNKLSHEIERYDNGAGELVAWVKVPSLSDTANTLLHLYYGHATAGNQQDATNVWPTSQFGGVWHMTSTNAQDSTANTNHVTSNAGTPIVTNSDFMGSAVYLTNATMSVPSRSSLNATEYMDFTVSFWFKASIPGSTAANSKFATKGASTATSKGWQIVAGATDLRPYATMGNGGTRISSTAQDSSYANSVWHYLVAVFDRDSNLTTYMDDGSAFKSVDISGSEDTNLTVTSAVIFGGLSGANIFAIMDEFRYCRVARDAAWRTACYRNQGNPSAYLTLGAEQLLPSGSVFTIR